ncbi:MAG: DUF5668 domain-containing protein [Ignavibacteriales bacterium]|nr:DUF5668 domain-containing protein [Ignavibacteriales bacterium]
MNTNKRFNIHPQMVIGAIIVIFGILFTLDNMGIIDNAGYYLRFWPVAIIAIGLIKIVSPTHHGERVAGLIVGGIGSLLLLWTLHALTFSIWSLWPLVLVFIGVKMLLNPRRHCEKSWSMQNETSSDPFFQQFVFMSGTNQQLTTDNFRGGDVTAIMGGTQLDLRHAQMAGDSAIINVFAFWGGIEIWVPDTWNVLLEGTPIMGGIDIKTLPQKHSDAKRLIIRGYAIMGGVEVKN